MSNRLKLIIGGAIVVIIVIVTIATMMINGQTPVEPDTPAPTESTQEKQNTPMHEGGEEMTKEDITYVDTIEDVARDQVIGYLKEQFPDRQTILITDVEWYFTDENKNQNLLVWAEVVDRDGKRNTEANVIEIETDGKTFSKKQIYKPDSRYAI